MAERKQREAGEDADQPDGQKEGGGANDHITLRLSTTLKEKFQKAATEKKLKLSPFILLTLQDALAGSQHQFPINEEAAGLLKHLAAVAGTTEGEFLAEVVSQLAREPYSPWLRRPGQQEVDLLEGSQIQQRHLAEIARATGTATISILLPRALAVDQAVPPHRMLLLLKAPLRQALANPSVRIRVLFIDRLAAERQEGEWGAFARQDEQFGRDLVGEADGEVANDRRRRLTVKYLSVADISGTLGQISDREFLNQFQVYADSAVCFTLETSLGLPLRYLVSTSQKDIEYWHKRFESLWEL